MLGKLLPLVFGGVLGLCFGSFANVLVYRLHAGVSLHRRSRCPACHAILQAKELVPIVSWFALGRRCLNCKKPISWQYPLVEGISLVLGVIVASRFSPLGAEAVWFYVELFFVLVLMVLVIMDLRWRELPVELMIAAGVSVGLVRFFSAFEQGSIRSWAEGILIALIVVIALLGGQWKFSRARWLGSGDVWFGVMMALVLGWPGTGIALYLGYLMAGCVALVLVITKKAGRHAHLPFAPALALGTILVWWFEKPLGKIVEHFLA